MSQHPAIHAVSPHPRVSKSYQFISTAEIIAAMEKVDFVVREQKQVQPRISDPSYVKHMVRFRHKSEAVIINGVVPEVLITNAHDGTAGFVMRAGLYRYICMNGMVVGHDIFKLRTTHIASAQSVVNEGLNHLSHVVFPSVQTQVKQWMGTILTEAQKLRLANKAIELRYTLTEPGYPPAKLLDLKRVSDQGDDLWTVFNVVQENITKGGVEGRTVTGRYAMSRPITAIDPDIRINAGLWAEAEKLATELA